MATALIHTIRLGIFLFFLSETLTSQLQTRPVGVLAQSARQYSSVAPPPQPAPILGGVCNLRSGNPCVPEATCTPAAPIVGEAICRCGKGFGGDGKREGSGCVNINECLNNSHDCNDRTQDCIDLPGSFRCVCKQGYRLAPDGESCLDVDECARPNLNNCDGITSTCHNTEGSYECRCSSESLIMDSFTGICRDLDECKDQGGVMNPCSQICTNMSPGVKCSCRDGYYLGPDKRICLDEDECANNTHTCAAFPGAVCENIPGSYRCVCSAETGWVTSSSDPRLCDNLNECRVHPYICGGPQSCCGDLMPPHKFACMMPVNSAAISTLRPTSSSLGSSLGGFNAEIGGGPIGPAAATVAMVRAAATAYNDDVVRSNDAAATPYSTNIFGSVGNQAAGILNEAAGVSSSQPLGIGAVVGSLLSKRDYAGPQGGMLANFGRNLMIDNDLDQLFDDYVIVVAGNRSIEQIHEELYTQISRRLYELSLSETLQNALTKTNSSSAVDIPQFLMDTDTSSTYSNDVSNPISRKQPPRRLQRIPALSSIGVLSNRMPGNIVPRLGSSQCPPGFNYAQDLYRSRVRQQAVQTIQTALVGSVNPDGSSTPGLTAETFTDGVVRNTNLLTNRVANWYNEIASVPGEFVATGGQVAAAFDPTNAFRAPVHVAGIHPAVKAAGAAVGTGLAVAGIDKAIYGGGPGDAIVLDRSGVSKKMAYGLM